MPVSARCWLLVACALLLAPARAAADGLSVEQRPGPVQPGQVVELTVTAPSSVSAVTATWGGREVVFVREPDGRWRALVGVDVADAPGSRSIPVSARLSDQTTISTTYTLTVEPKVFRTRRIRVDPRFVTPPADALPRIKQETELLNALFREASPERLWTPDAVRPVEGVAVSGFGVRSIMNGQAGGPHNGLDLSAVTGTPVHAPTAGIIVYARDFYYSGNTVIVDHGHGLYSTMAHLSAIDVREGDRVARGALLGKVGATGRVTGPHLHWAVRLHGARVDPLSLLSTLTTRSSAP